MYNLTNLSASTSVVGVARFANDAAQGYLFGFALIATFFIILVTLKRFEFEGGLVTASWITFVLGVILSYGGWVNIIFPLGFMALAAFTTMYSWASGRLN